MTIHNSTKCTTSERAEQLCQHIPSRVAIDLKLFEQFRHKSGYQA